MHKAMCSHLNLDQEVINNFPQQGSSSAMGLPQSNTHATFRPRGVTSGHTWLEVDELPISKLKTLMGAQWMAGQVVMSSAEIQAKQQRKDQHESQSNVYRKCMLVSPCGREWFCLTLNMQGHSA